MQKLATTNSQNEVLEQEKDAFARDLGVACSRESVALDKISNMLSPAQLAEEKVKKAETNLEDSLEKLTDSYLLLTSLERIVKELKENISQDEAMLSEQKKVWA